MEKDNLLLQLFDSYVCLVIEKYQNKCLAAKIQELLTNIENIENYFNCTNNQFTRQSESLFFCKEREIKHKIINPCQARTERVSCEKKKLDVIVSMVRA